MSEICGAHYGSIRVGSVWSTRDAASTFWTFAIWVLDPMMSCVMDAYCEHQPDCHINHARLFPMFQWWHQEQDSPLCRPLSHKRTYNSPCLQMQYSRQIQLIKNVGCQRISKITNDITVMSVLGKKGPKYGSFGRSRRLDMVDNIDQSGYT